MHESDIDAQVVRRGVAFTVTPFGLEIAAEQVEPQIQELEKMVTKPMVIDCTALEYVASAGLRLLLRIRKAAKASGQDVTLLSVNENVMEVLKVTHFDRMFTIK